MKKFITALSLFFISLVTFCQVSENRTIGDFSKLKASQSVRVLYTISNNISLKVETDDNQKLKFIKTEVENGVLKIFIETSSSADSNEKSNKKKRNYNNNVNFKLLNVYVTGPSLQEIKASSSADVIVKNVNTANTVSIDVSSSGSISGKFHCENISIEASSSGDFIAEIEAKSVSIESGSSSDVKLYGKTTQFMAKSSSSSMVNAQKLVSETAVAKSSSSASIDLFVTKSLQAMASSSSDINYYGNPAQVSVEKSSSGSINKR
jgi:hypothetical protein